MKISLNKNIKNSNKNFTDFEEKKGEFLRLTYKSFLTNDKKYDEDKIKKYKDIANILTLVVCVLIYLPALNNNFDNFINNNFINKMTNPQNPYIVPILAFLVFFAMPIIITIFINILFESIYNCYKKTIFLASKDGILLKSKKSEISFKKENISRFCIDKEINRQDTIPPVAISEKKSLTLMKLNNSKEESFCIVIVCKKSINLPVYGTPQKEFVLFTNLSEEKAKYLVNSMNYIIFGLC